MRSLLGKYVRGVAVVIVWSGLTTCAMAQQPPVVIGAGQPGEPRGGQPPAGSKPSTTDWDYQVKYHRAFEAVLWNMPAIAIYSFRRAAFEDLGLKDNDIIAYSAPATPKLEVEFTRFGGRLRAWHSSRFWVGLRGRLNC